MEILDLIAKVSWETNTKALDQLNAELRKEDKILDELRRKGGRLQEQMAKTNDPKKVKSLNDELRKTQQQADKITESQKKQAQMTDELRKKQKQLGDELRKTTDPKATQQFVRELHKVENQMDALNKKASASGSGGLLGKLAMGAAGFVSVGLITAQIKQAFGVAIAEFENADRQARLLLGTLKNIGAETYFDSLISESNELQKQFSYLDSADIVEAQQKLLTYGKVTRKEISQLLPVIIDLAARTGQSLPEATQLAILALEGQGRQLKQYGLNVKDAKTFTERFNVVVADLGTKVKGSAEDFKNSSAGIKAAAEQSVRDTLATYGEAASKIELFFKKSVAGLYMLISDLTTSSKEAAQKRQDKVLNNAKVFAEGLSKQELEIQQKQNKAREAEIKAGEARIAAMREDIRKKGRDGMTRAEWQDIQKRIAAEEELIAKTKATIEAINQAKKTAAKRAQKEAEMQRVVDENRTAEERAEAAKKSEEAAKKAAEEQLKLQNQLHADYLAAQQQFIIERNEADMTAEMKELANLSAHFAKIVDAYNKVGKDVTAVIEFWEKQQGEIRKKYQDRRAMQALSLPSGTAASAEVSEMGIPAWVQMLGNSARRSAEGLQARKESIQLLAQEAIVAIDTASIVVDAERRKTEALIGLQQDRVDAARSNSEVSLKIEQDRLQALVAERQKYENAQRAIDATVIAANQALAISNSIVSISEAAKAGGPAAPFTIAANVLAITAGLVAATAAIRNATANQGFKDGGFTGEGDPSAVSTTLGNKPYTYHKGEFVMDADLTAKNRDMFEAIHKRKLVAHQLRSGSYVLAPQGIDVDKAVSDHTAVTQSMSLMPLLGEMQSMRQLLSQREVRINNTFDANGFGQAVATQIGNISLFNLMRS